MNPLLLTMFTQVKVLFQHDIQNFQWWHSFVHVQCHFVHLLPGSRAICHFRQPSRHSPVLFCWGGQSRGTTSGGQREHGGWRRRWSAGWRWCLLPYRVGQNILGKTTTRYLRAFCPWMLIMWGLNNEFKAWAMMANGWLWLNYSTVKALDCCLESWRFKPQYLQPVTVVSLSKRC